MSTDLALTGNLTLDTVASRENEISASLAALTTGAQLTVDLSGVTEVDSSSLTLLLSWLRQAQTREVALHFTGLPTAIAQLLAVYGLQDILQPAESK